MTKSVVRRILTRCIMLAFIGTAVSFSLAGPASGKALIVEKGIIKSDTLWEKEVIIKGDVEIARGATLIVMPGTVVRFVKIDANGPADNPNREHHFPRAELVVRGRILAQGTRERMISFTSAEDSPHPADWGAINLLDTTGNVLEFCEVSHANTGLHCHGGQVVVANCYFHDNGVAIGQKNVEEFETRCVISILYNRITGNGGGILFGKGTSPTISHNEICNNKFFGIYAKKAGAANVRYNNAVRNGKGVILFAVKDFRLRENNISDNKEYNISLLEGQIWDVDARHNWWGTTDEKQIKNLIWDKDEDDSLGKLDFSDFAGSPIEGAGVPQ